MLYIRVYFLAMRDSFELDLNRTEVDITIQFDLEPIYNVIKFKLDDLHNPTNERLRVVLLEDTGISRSYIIRNHENFVLPIIDPKVNISIMFNKNREELQKANPHIRVNFELHK